MLEILTLAKGVTETPPAQIAGNMADKPTVAQSGRQFLVGNILAKDREFGLVIDAKNAKGVIQIRARTATHRHRADVTLDDLNEIAECGLSGGYWSVRCAKRQNPDGMAIIGNAPNSLLIRVKRALIRENEATRTERTYELDPDVAYVFWKSQLFSRMNFGCRRVGAMTHH